MPFFALLAAPTKAAELGTAGHARLEREASWKDVASKVLACYGALVAARGGTGAEADDRSPTSTAR